MLRISALLASALVLSGAAAAQDGRDPESLWYMPNGLFLPDSQARPLRSVTLEQDFADWPSEVEINERHAPFRSRSVGMVEFTTPWQRPLILYCGGSAFRSTAPMAPLAARLLQYGDLIIMDYPGFGRTRGRFRRSLMVEAAEAAAVYARERADEMNRPLVLWGVSVGGMVCPFAADAAGGADLVVLETPSIRHSSATNPEQAPHVQVNALEGHTRSAVVLIASRDVEPVSAYERLTSDLRDAGVDATAQIYEADHGSVLFHADLEARLAPIFQALMDDDGVE